MDAGTVVVAVVGPGAAAAAAAGMPAAGAAAAEAGAEPLAGETAGAEGPACKPFSKRDQNKFMRPVRRASAPSIAYLLINGQTRICFEPGLYVTLRYMISVGVKTIDGKLFAEAIRVSQFLTALAGEKVRQEPFEQAIWTQDRRAAARLVRDVLDAHGGKMKLEPFQMLLLYTVKPNCDESKCRNEIIGIFDVESVSLLETAEVCGLCKLLCCVYSVIALTCMYMWRILMPWFLWLQDAVVPDARRPFNWLECYREGLYAQSETAHKEAKREGEPREPEMRVVLEGTLKAAPEGARIRAPVQHSNGGPYRVPISLLQESLERCRLGQA